jgi:MoaA/NifB/PqqE/SkfB family radical SAM enzyme
MFNLPEKPRNLIQAGFSYLKSSVTGRPEVIGMPVSIGIELTNTCNLRCPECITGSGNLLRSQGFMNIELFKRVINELSPYLYNTNLYFQGEPMLHPQFFSFLENSRNTYTTVSTNGHYLSAGDSEKIVRSGLNHLIISLDGMDQVTYSLYRKNGNLKTVIGGIKNVAEAKIRFRSKIKLEIQFLVNKINEHQIPQIKELAKSFSASLRLKSMQVSDKKEVARWLPVNGKFRRYILRNGEYVIKSNLGRKSFTLLF